MKTYELSKAFLNVVCGRRFKVKILPGQTKRGKASKTAMSVFLADKTATGRERDLIKSLKDQDLGRNFPGRVKLAVPQSLKPKK